MLNMTDNTPRTYRFAILNDYGQIRNMAMLIAALILACIIYSIIKPIFGKSDSDGLLWGLMVVGFAIVTMTNLYLIGWNRGNSILVGDESVTFSVHRPNISPVFVPVMRSEMESVKKTGKGSGIFPESMNYDEESGTLYLYKNPWGGNVEITLKKDRVMKYTEFKHFVIPRLKHEEYHIKKIVFGPSDVEGVMRELEKPGI
jgi:hypothetical protein